MRWEHKFSRGSRRRIGLVAIILCAVINNPTIARTITVDNDGPAEAIKSYLGEPIREAIVASDINGDCTVGFQDFMILTSHWLEERQ